MTARRTLAVARKEFLHIRRDARSLGLGLAIPVMLVLLFGYVLTLDVDKVALAVWDQSGTPASRELVSRFQGSRYFRIARVVEDCGAIERAIDAEDAVAALVIPRGFDPGGAPGPSRSVQFIVDGSEANTATIAVGYAEAVVSGHSTGLSVAWARSRGMPPPRPPVDLRSRVWFNPDLESRTFIVPGLIAVIMMIIAALLTSLTVAREWEQGTMEQLVATPATGAEIVIGKLIPYFAIGMVDMTVVVAMGKFLFDVPVRGSLALLFGVSALFLVGALALGMLFGITARSQLLASQMAMVVTFLPSYLLSGFVFSIDNMPAAVRAITYVVPARYFVAALKAICLKGVGAGVLAVEIALLTAFAAAAVALAVRKFRKKLL